MMSDSRQAATTARTVSLNAISNAVVMGLDLAIQFVLLRFILAMLGTELYGIWVITGGVFAYSTLLQLGINSAVNYYIAPMLARREFDRLNRLVSTAVVFYGVVSTVVLGATALLLVYFPVWFSSSIEPAHAGLSRILVAVVGGFFVLSTPLVVYQGVVSGLQRYVPMNVARLICRVSRMVLIISLLWAGCGLLGLAAAHVISRLAEALAIPFLAERYLPELRFRFSLASMSTFRQMLGYSIHTLLWSLSYTIREGAAIVVIGVLLTATAASLYSVPIMVMKAAYALVQAFASVTKPAASALLAEGGLAKIKAMVLRGNRLVGAGVLAMAAVLLVYGQTIIVLWVNKEEFRPMGGVLSVLLIGELPALVQLVSAYVLIGMGRQRLFALFTVVMALLSLVMMILLVSVWEAGLWGIAAATAIPAFITGALFVPTYTCRVLGSSLLHYLWASFVRPLLAVMPFAVTLAALRWYYDPQSAGALALVGVVSAPVLLIGGYLIAMETGERELVLSFAGKLRRRLARTGS